jgi:radical SAM superfamily enzyme YgiQ (UPF0313 family)
MRYNKVLLLVPPFYRIFGGRNNWVSLGFGYIAGVLNEHGFYTKIYNTDYSDTNKDVDLEDIFNAYDIYRNSVNDIDNPIWKEIIEKIKEFNPDIIGITLVFSVTVKSALNIANLIKKSLPNVKIVVGGPHATILPDDTLSYEEFDFLVRGEGEYTLLDLVEGKPLNEIQGLSYKENGKIIHNQEREFIRNLDVLPFPKPEYFLIPIKDIKNNFGVVATSRGCPYKCSFCCSPTIWKQKVRYRSIPNIIRELLFRRDKYGVDTFYFSDDSFNLNIKRGKALCRAILTNKLKIRYFCEANIKPFDDELMSLMKDSGCIRLKLGVESGNNRILQLMRKRITTDDIKETCRLAKKFQVPFTIYIMIGFVTETLDEMMDTYNLVKEVEPDYVSLSIATPQIGSELADMCISHGIVLPHTNWENYFHQSKQSMINPNINIDVINKFVNLNKKYENTPPYKLECKE